MKSKDKESFVKALEVSDVVESQEKLANEQIKSMVYRELARFDFKSEKKLNLVDLAQKVANQCNYADSSKISNMIELWLESPDSIYEIDRKIAYRPKSEQSEDYEIYEVKTIIEQPSKAYSLQMEWQEEQNRKANKQLDDFVSRVQAIRAELPDNKKSDIEAIRAGFSEHDLENNKIWIDLALQRAVKLDTVDSSDLELIDR